MKKKYDVCYKQEGKDGKGYWKQIGVVLEGDKGLSLKLEVVPLGWNGFAGLFEPKPKEDTADSGIKRSKDVDEDIPF